MTEAAARTTAIMDEKDPELSPEPSTRSRRARWGVRLAAVSCVGWLVVVVLHHLLSARTYVWGPVDLLPPIAWAAVPVVLLPIAWLARPMRRRLVGAALLALVLGIGYSGINFATVFYTPPPAPADAVKVVTWNTEYWDQDRRNGGEQRTTTGQFYDFLREMDADVYLLHEYANVDDSLVDVFAQAYEIDQTAQLNAAFPGYTIVREGRNITLTRLPVVGHAWLDSQPYLPDDLKPVPPALVDRPLFYRSQALRTDIRVNGQVVSFYNSHIFQPPVRILLLRSDDDRNMFEIDRLNFEIRQASYRAIAADLKKNPNRAVMAGDLNTSPSMNLLDMVSDRLVDQSRALSSLYPVTWPVGDKPRMWRIDWLFTTPDIKVHNYDLTLPKGLSDHKAQQFVISAP
ncbi:endonuclease/exonuclease/phosphatase family protein [Micromonospora arborensis]|uniref:endonuclease/exonuclease/phosphatase family protein n=1 Tax=Micromonospora arborensis TaxID=2116518 RepID=UPI0011B5662C|nr:endonuclease/exonuclease/phosphatase family protein [Micromonospora arborensis]